MSTLVWGCPNAGALGLEKTMKDVVVAVPTAPGSLLAGSEVVSSAGGQGHSLWLDASGRVWATGRNKEGQCGVSLGQAQLNTPTAVSALARLFVTNIATGALSSAAVADGKLFEWGFVVTSLRSKEAVEAEDAGGAAGGEETLQDAMESMVQLTGLTSRLRDRPGLRKLVTKSNLAYMTAQNRRHAQSDGADAEDEAVLLYRAQAAAVDTIAAEQEAGGAAALQADAVVGDAEDTTGLEALARGVIRMQARRESRPHPTLCQELVEAGVTVVKVAAGYAHTVVLDSAGRVWSKGYNDRGQLGQNHRITMPYFRTMAWGTMPPGTVVVDIACGTSHTLLLTAEGQVYACGAGGLGQLGQERRGDRLLPVRVTWRDALYTASGWSTAVSIAAGANHTAIVDGSGALWTCGHSEYAQMAPPAALQDASRAALAKTSSGGDGASASADGSSHARGRDDRLVDARFYYVPRRMEGTGTGPGCVLRAAGVFSGNGANYTAVTTAEGGLMTFGWNAWGVLGRSANINAGAAQRGTVCLDAFRDSAGQPVRSVGCGQNHVLVVTESEGNRFARGWGEVLTGQTATADTLAVALDETGAIVGGNGIPLHAGILAARCPALGRLLTEAVGSAPWAHTPRPPAPGDARVHVVVMPVEGDTTHSAKTGFVDLPPTAPSGAADGAAWLRGLVEKDNHDMEPVRSKGATPRGVGPAPASGAGVGTDLGFSLGAAPGGAGGAETYSAPPSRPAPPAAVLVFPRTHRRVLQALVLYLYTDTLRCPSHRLPQLRSLASRLLLTRLVGLAERALGGQGGPVQDTSMVESWGAVGSDTILDLARDAAEAASEFFAARARATVARLEAQGGVGRTPAGRRPGRLLPPGATAASRSARRVAAGRAVVDKVVSALTSPVGAQAGGTTPPAPQEGPKITKSVSGEAAAHATLATTVEPSPSRWGLDMGVGLEWGLFPDVALIVRGNETDDAGVESPAQGVFFAHKAVLRRYPYFRHLLGDSFSDAAGTPEGAAGRGAGAALAGTAPPLASFPSRNSGSRVFLDDVPPSLFRLALSWMYTGNKDMLDGERCLGLLAVGSRLTIEDLVGAAEAVACDACDGDSAPMLCDFAESFSLARLFAHARATCREAGLQVPGVTVPGPGGEWSAMLSMVA